MTIDAKPTSFLISILRGMHTRGELVLSPKFQRRPVWPPAAKSFFIDTLLRGFPVPPMHLRVTRPAGASESVLEVVDGQQRLRTVFDFLAGDIRLSRSLDAEWAGKKFAQLDEEERNELLDRQLTVFQYSSISDRDVLQIFERFNANSIQLNAQELRNGRFFGQFKQSCYDLARDYLEFWQSAKIFTDQSIARMLEVEFVSELLAMQLRGMQDKKNSLNDIYSDLDDEWPGRAEEESKFREVSDFIIDALGSTLPDTAFTKRPLFYTLFGVLMHYRYGIPGVDEVTHHRPFTDAVAERLRVAVGYWSDVMTREDEPEDEIDPETGLISISEPEIVQELTGAELQFREASTSQTDNIAPRRQRFHSLYESFVRDENHS